MVPTTVQEKLRLAVAICALVALVTVVALFIESGALQEYWGRFVDLVENKEHLRAYLKSWGALAPFVFILIQSLQVVVAPIPGELTGIAGGFVFGTFWNVVYSTIGLTAGSAIAFAVARIVGMPFVQLIVNQRTMKRFGFLTKRRGKIAALALFAIPGFPKDVLSYLLGLSPMPFLTFILVCLLGRLPGTVLLSLSGSALYKENWCTLMILALCFGIIFVISYIKKDRIKAWIMEVKHTHKQED